VEKRGAHSRQRARPWRARGQRRGVSLARGRLLVSSYETAFGDEPVQSGVNYWGYDSEAKRFRIIFFSNNGPYTEDGNRYEGKVTDGKLTFEGPRRDTVGGVVAAR
jgi:hypothetical protein